MVEEESSESHETLDMISSHSSPKDYVKQKCDIHHKAIVNGERGQEPKHATLLCI